MDTTDKKQIKEKPAKTFFFFKCVFNSNTLFNWFLNSILTTSSNFKYCEDSFTFDESSFYNLLPLPQEKKKEKRKKKSIAAEK